MDKIAHSRDHLRPLDEFFVDASSGNLPSFSWINPRSGINITSGIGSNDQHPDHDMNAGEQYIKDIYESVRASPQWNETLLIITYDEHGGFYDHVTPPDVDIPAPNDGEVSYPGEGFQFNRLGLRIPTLLISPWIAKNTIVSGMLICKSHLMEICIMYLFIFIFSYKNICDVLHKNDVFLLTTQGPLILRNHFHLLSSI